MSVSGGSRFNVLFPKVQRYFSQDCTTCIFDVDSTQVVRPCTSVMFVVLHSMQPVWLIFHEPCMVHCVTCLLIVVVDVGVRCMSIECLGIAILYCIC